MGFNKRIVTAKSVLDCFNEGGTNAVVKLFNADAIIFHGERQDDITKIFKAILDENYADTRKYISELYIKTKS